MKRKTRKIIAIVGPTASGKTGIGVSLAKDFNGEIISADSRQVFRGMDIGTGKDLSEYDGVRYHLIDVVNPGDDFSMFKWLELARLAIEDIFSRGKTPIIVGGTGLYIQALVEGFQLKQTQISNLKTQNYGSHSMAGLLSREQLENLTIEELQNFLKKIDPEAYEKVDLNNPHRLIRAIEKAQEGIKPMKIKPDFEALQIGIDWPRDELYGRIDKRVDQRFEEGMLEEIVSLLNSGVDYRWLSRLGLEYRVITDFVISNSKFLVSKQLPNSEIQKLKNNPEFSKMKQVLKYKIHQFARRQLTWFRRFPDIKWENDYEKIKKLLRSFLN